jgi:mannosylfructose-6-phosphate phosphatase
VYSSGRDLDVSQGTQGQRPRWLCEVGLSLDTVLVAGDTGNDRSLFLLPGVRGIVVENARQNHQSGRPTSHL